MTDLAELSWNSEILRVDLVVRPSNILFGRNLKDQLPATIDNLKVRKEWRFDRDMREQALAIKFAELEKELGGGARKLRDLEVGDMVQIQNQRGNDPKRWNKSGKIVEKLDYDQYLVKVDGGGRITRRNRRYLKKINEKVEIIGEHKYSLI